MENIKDLTNGKSAKWSTIATAIDNNFTETGDKQDRLVSGTNIKTINNVNILGEGNIHLGGGSNGIVGKIDTNGNGTGEIFNNYTNNKATGNHSHAEGQYTRATGDCAHSEGYNTDANGSNSHSEGWYTRATGSCSHVEGWNTDATGSYSHAEGEKTQATGQSSHAEGRDTKAINDCTHAEGHHCRAEGADASHAEGFSCVAQGDYGSHAEGQSTLASGQSSHAEGLGSKAENTAAHAEGIRTVASGNGSHSSGAETKAENCREFVIGQYNELDTSPSPNNFNSNKPAFVIGNGSSSLRGNAFKVLFNGQTFADREYSSAGADYAEFFEWKDANLTNEDRVGRFVTLDGDKIRFATTTDTYILGIISAAPAIIGDNPMRWQGKYLNDEWGRPIYEEVTVNYEELVAEKDENGNIINKMVEKTRTDYIRKINPEFNPEVDYISRAERPEWDYVGMMGKLLVKQDGTLVAGSFCKSGNDGVATKADNGYYVMKVINENQALILFR